MGGGGAWQKTVINRAALYMFKPGLSAGALANANDYECNRKNVQRK